VKPVLVIQCGGLKRLGTHAVRDLYLGPLWSTFRKAAPEGPHPALDVYVLSAEHGLLSEMDLCPAYDRVLVSDSYRSSEKGGTPVRRIAELVPVLAVQRKALGLHRVHAVGGKTYLEALRRAGFAVDPVSTGAGIGYIRSDLGRFLEAHRMSLISTLLARARGE